MKPPLAFALIILLPYSFVNGQVSFQKTYGTTQNEWGNAVTQCYDGGYIAAGGFAAYGAYVVRTDALGDTLWTRKISTSQMVAFDVIQTQDSNFVVSGYINSFGNGFVYKLDDTGSIIWTRSYPGQSWVQSVYENTDGSFVSGGALLIRLNSDGYMSWSQGTGSQLMYVIESNDGNYVGVGFGTSSIQLHKRDTSGNFIWDKTYQGRLINTCNRNMFQTPDGGYAIAGQSWNYKGLLIKTDSNGDTLWTRVYADLNYATSIAPSGNGGYAIVGRSLNTTGVMLIVTDSIGNTVGNYSLNWGGSDAKSVERTADGGYVICGQMDPGNGQLSDLLLVKIMPADINPVGMNEPLSVQTHQMDVFPNPVSGGSMYCAIHLENGTLELMDETGRIVLQKNHLTGDRFQLDISGLRQGIYLMRALQDGVMLDSKRLIVAR